MQGWLASQLKVTELFFFFFPLSLSPQPSDSKKNISTGSELSSSFESDVSSGLGGEPGVAG